MRFMSKVPGFTELSIHQVAGGCTMTDAQATEQIAWAIGRGLMYAHPFSFETEKSERIEAFQRLGHKFKHFRVSLERTLNDPCDPKILTSFLQNRKWFIEALNKIRKGEEVSVHDLRRSSSILIDRLLPHLAWAIGRGEMEQIKPARGETRKDALQQKVFRKLTDAHSFGTPALETISDPCDEKTIVFAVTEPAKESK